MHTSIEKWMEIVLENQQQTSQTNNPQIEKFKRRAGKRARAGTRARAGSGNNKNLSIS